MLWHRLFIECLVEGSEDGLVVDFLWDGVDYVLNLPGGFTEMK